jgi:RHS repeat-associated protein
VPALHSTDSLTRNYDLAGNDINSLQRVLACPTRLVCQPEDQLTAWAERDTYYRGDGRIVLAQRQTSNDPFNGAPTDNVMPYSAMGRGVFEQYRYDALGRRVWRRAHRDWYCGGIDPNDAPICASFIERTVYDGDQVIAEIRQPSSDSTTVVESDDGAGFRSTTPGDYGQYGIVAYLNGAGIDSPLALARAGTSDTTLLLLHRDWQGSIDFTTRSDGAIVDCGRPGALTQAGGCVALKWPGETISVGYQQPVTNVGVSDWWGTLIAGNVMETGMIDFRARQFDPATGTFLQEDPLGVAGGANTYAFGGGDPVNRRDPSGMLAVLWCEIGATYWGCGTWDSDAGYGRVLGQGSFDPPSGFSTNFGNPNARGGFGLGVSSDVGSSGGGGGWSCGFSCGKGVSAPPPPSYKASQLEVCTMAHYGLGSLSIRGASAALASTVSKTASGLPRAGGGSAYTNALSYFGLRQFPGLKIGTQILGTNRVFGLLGRANLALGVGLAAYDVTSIGMCTAGY